MEKKQQPDCPYYRDIDKRHSIYLSNVLLLNRFGIILQSGTTPHVENHCFGAKRNYIWCFHIHIVQFNSKSLDHDWKIFSLH